MYPYFKSRFLNKLYSSGQRSDTAVMIIERAENYYKYKDDNEPDS
jgi:hypothetical protein